MSAPSAAGARRSARDQVVLTGRPGGTTHLAVEALATLPGEFRLIGGLAVLCRVGVPHRATVDLDALARNLDRYDPELQRLALSSSGGGQYVMPGRLDLDVIEVSADSATGVLELLEAHGPLTDLEFNVVAHTWAHDAATPVAIWVFDAGGGELVAEVQRLVASTAGLVAMKAATVPLRASSKPEKRASDLYDLARLLVGAVGADGINEAPGALRDEVVSSLRAWFVDPRGRDRTYREIRRFDEVAIDMDEVAGSVEDLATGFQAASDQAASEQADSDRVEGG